MYTKLGPDRRLIRWGWRPVQRFYVLERRWTVPDRAIIAVSLARGRPARGINFINQPVTVSLYRFRFRAKLLNDVGEFNRPR